MNPIQQTKQKLRVEMGTSPYPSPHRRCRVVDEELQWPNPRYRNF